MKKAVITILMALPFVLIVVISVAGMLLSEYTHIAVEDVGFIADDGAIIQKYTLGKDTEAKLRVQVFPKLASNQQVKFSSSDDTVCTVDGEGVVRGVDYGTVVVTVVTTENRKSAALQIKVSDSPYPTSITLSSENLDIRIKETVRLTAAILPITAANKAVLWSTSDPSIASVDQNGRVSGVGEGIAVITATTLENGLTADCTVTVTDQKVPLKWVDYEEGKDVYDVSADSIDLVTLVEYDGDIVSPEDIVFQIISGGKNGTLEGGILTFQDKGILRLIVKANGHEAEILIRRAATQ